jgi:acyl-CoA synthetase (AMP-forming)/AMP-acid ligase II
VPINYKAPVETVHFVIADSQVRFVFSDAERRHLVPAGIATVILDDPAQWPAFLDEGAFPTVEMAPDETAMILYTSGSSGRPKGVVLSHGGQYWAVQSRLRGGPYDNERILVAAPLFHMNGLANCKFACAAHAMMVLMPQFGAREYIRTIERHAVTWLTGVPTMFALVVRESAALNALDVSKVRYIRMASAPATQKLFDDVRQAFPHAAVGGGFGTTETGPVMFGPSPTGAKKADLELGWPLPQVEVRLVDSDGKDANEGVLWIRTPANMKGYLNLPEKTREVLRPDGWYISGDVFRRNANGAFEFVGRSDDMFVCGGENIYPGEVELMLERHPDIRQACVVPVPDELKGAKPFAFVMLRNGSVMTEQDVKTYALAHAPAYQHPRFVRFVQDFPLAGTNKIDRRALLMTALEAMRTLQTPA